MSSLVSLTRCTVGDIFVSMLLLGVVKKFSKERVRVSSLYV